MQRHFLFSGILVCALSGAVYGQDKGAASPAVPKKGEKAEIQSDPKAKESVKPATPKAPAAKTPAAPRRIYSDIKQVDDQNYHYTGEFMGKAMLNHAYKTYGLQVAVHKDGEFVATLYQDGLPGDGWEFSTVERSNAKIQDGKLEFAFNGAMIQITHDSAKVKPSDSSTTYSLTKILRESPTMGLQAPADAVVLFKHGQANKLLEPKITSDGLLQEGTETTEAYKDFRIHAEFRVPYLPDDDDQKRGNSGLYLQSRYEIQILDSFGEDTRFNSIGALYRQQPAALNMALPPLVWQTYDIWFTAAKFDAEGKKTSPAKVTVFLNGVPVHYDREIATKTGAGKPEGAEALVTKFQNHQDPVRFRNIWIQPGEQPLPPNAVIASKKTSTSSAVSTVASDVIYQGYESSPVVYEGYAPASYPYAQPWNYTRHEQYGHYGKMWPW